MCAPGPCVCTCGVLRSALAPDPSCAVKHLPHCFICTYSETLEASRFFYSLLNDKVLLESTNKASATCRLFLFSFPTLYLLKKEPGCLAVEHVTHHLGVLSSGPHIGHLARLNAHQTVVCAVSRCLTIAQ